MYFLYFYVFVFLYISVFADILLCYDIFMFPIGIFSGRCTSGDSEYIIFQNHVNININSLPSFGFSTTKISKI